MKKMKHTMKSLAFLLALTMLAISLTACSGKQQPSVSSSDEKTTAKTADDYPNKAVTIICPWGVGGGADTIARKIT